jgi:rhamnose utilization protein RhaD (predicted bifunctional aldolase and dehydrogenase)
MTPDYPMYTRILPLWIDVDLNDSPEAIFSYINTAVDKYVSDYKDHLKNLDITDVPISDLFPQAIVHPQIGVICIGPNESSANKIADFIHQAFLIREEIFATGGTYESLPEEHIFDMQYRGYQQAKKCRS